MVNDNQVNEVVQGAAPVVTPETAPENTTAEPAVQGAVEEPPKLDFSAIMGQAQSVPVAPEDDDLVRQVRDFRKQGLSPQEISTRLSVGSMDFGKMTEMELVVQKTMIETKLDRQTVVEALEETYGTEGAQTAGQRLKLAQDAHQAKDILSKMTVKQEVAEPTVNNQQIKDSWGVVGDSIINANKSLPFSIKDKDLDYSGVFNVPDDVIAKIKPLLADYAASNGLPFTAEGGQKLQEFYENLVFVAARKEIIATHIRDAYAKGLEKGASLGAGGNIVTRNQSVANSEADFLAKVVAKQEGRN